jgi:hypothetical protein
MISISKQLNLQPADSIVVPKSELRMIEHYIVFLGCDELGNEWFAENNNVVGVRIIQAKDIRNDLIQVNRVKKFIGTNHQRMLAVKRALQEAGRPYSLINYNCEHFSNKVQTGKASSRQVAWGFGIAATIALVLILKR